MSVLIHLSFVSLDRSSLQHKPDEMGKLSR